MSARAWIATLGIAGAVMSGTVLAAPLSAEAPSAQGQAPTLNPASDSAEIAIVADLAVPLRASARAASPVQAQLSRGNLLEVRGAVPGYLRVYDHRRERPGFVRPAQVRRYRLEANQLPALTALALFFRDQPGSEELGVAYASVARSISADARGAHDAAPPAAPASSDPLDDALGQMIDRLARRVSQARAVPDSALAQALEVAAGYGVKLVALEHADHVIYCSDGAAETRALSRGDGAERARAALLLTQPRCGDPALPIARQREWNEWRAQIAARTEPADAPPELGAKLHLRRAEIWSQLAFLRSVERRAAMSTAMLGDGATPPAQGATPDAAAASRAAEHELALADRGLLAEEDQPAFDEVTVRVAAARWPGSSEGLPRESAAGLLRVRSAPRPESAGGIELLADGLCTNDCKPALAVAGNALPFPASLRIAPQGRAAAMVVQPLAGWTELWVFHLAHDGPGRPPRWVHTVLVPAATEPGLGAIECAGFTPKGKSMLVVRQAMVDGKLRRQFQELSLETLRVVAQSDRIDGVRDFARWASADWREHTTALR